MEILFIGEEPKVIFSVKAHTQIETAVQYCQDEVSWLGRVTRESENFLVHEIFIPAQKVHSTTTEMTPDGLSQLYLRLIQEGVDTDQLCYHGHSHATMDVGPSGQDNKEFDNFDDQLPFFVRTIHNKKGETHADIIDRERGILLKNVSTQIWYASDEEVIQTIKKDIDDGVTKLVTTYRGHVYGGKATQFNQEDWVTGLSRKWQKGKDGKWRWEEIEDNGDGRLIESSGSIYERYLIRVSFAEFKIVTPEASILDSDAVVAVLNDKPTGGSRIVIKNSKEEFLVVDREHNYKSGYWRVGRVLDLSTKMESLA